MHSLLNSAPSGRSPVRESMAPPFSRDDASPNVDEFTTRQPSSPPQTTHYSSVPRKPSNRPGTDEGLVPQVPKRTTRSRRTPPQSTPDDDFSRRYGGSRSSLPPSSSPPVAEPSRQKSRRSRRSSRSSSKKDNMLTSKNYSESSSFLGESGGGDRSKQNLDYSASPDGRHRSSTRSKDHLSKPSHYDKSRTREEGEPLVSSRPRARRAVPSSSSLVESKMRRKQSSSSYVPEELYKRQTSSRSSRKSADISPGSVPRASSSARRSSRRSKRSLHRESSSSTDGGRSNQENMSMVHKYARKHEWDEMLEQCRLRPEEAMYVHQYDGTTALHVTVMSRTGYSPPVQDDDDIFVAEPNPAPLAVIEELLQLCPEAAKVTCNINSYTPLAYACLVSGQEWNLDDSAAMVRLFLQLAPESLSIFTEGGLSALDVHIISFSYKKREQQMEEDATSGRTSTVVLRTLLEADPRLAHVRIREDKVGGPIELLYRCNSGAFMDAVDLDDKSYMKRNDSDSKSVIATITNWWVWKWTILLLKYGSMSYKKKGAPFLALHAAASMVGCPLPVLTLALKAFPKQIRQEDMMRGDQGNLPLHLVATWPCQQDSESTDPVISSRKGMAISALLQEYPDAAMITNSSNQYPLQLAVQNGTTWDGGARKLVRAYSNAVSQPSPDTGLYPFLSAAIAASGSISSEPLSLNSASTKKSDSMPMKVAAKRELQSVRTIYGLLRADPSVMDKLILGDSLEEEDSDSGSDS